MAQQETKQIFVVWDFAIQALKTKLDRARH